MTVEQYVQRWLDTLGAASDHHATYLDQYVLPRLGRCQLAEITPSDIKLLLNRVTQAADTQTADEVHRTCQALYDAAIDDGFLTRSPVPPRRSGSALPD